MNTKVIILVLMTIQFFLLSNAQAMFDDDPWLSKVMSEFEYFSENGEGVLEWDIDAWTGRDLSKIWLKSSGERSNSELHHANIELVYSHAKSAYWDQQFGIRHDFSSDSQEKNRNWASYGWIGTAPYFIEVDARIFVGEESSSQLLIELEREIMLTQEWVLTPELDIVANGRTNEDYAEGSGLAEVEFSLRLGYEHRANRKFQPFIGLSASQKFGTTRSLVEKNGGMRNSVEFVVGIHSWF